MAGTIMALVLENREGCAPAVQKVLTENGCVIKTRLGMHEACENRGLILLHLEGTTSELVTLSGSLSAIKGVKVKSMEIDF